MPTEIQDVLKANIVLAGVSLLTEPTEQDAFISAVGTEISLGMGIVFTGPAPATIPEPGRTLSLDRDRINLNLSPSRSIIERNYPRCDDLDRLAEVAGYAFAHTDLKGKAPSAFGCNIELVYRQTSGVSANHYLAERPFTDKRIGNEGWELLGGTGRLLFEGDGALWTLALEPRANDPTQSRVFLSLNLHKSEQRLPSQDEVLISLQEIWRQAHHFVTRLDESV